ncbi:hypothetical protein [Streptomyces sp. ST2-7A]|uniref:hypothetical protein n=1 Tax=Streptomyces sp. ST2-7A TaxID=2907214 RepID=UPI001F45D2E5|nr:hypothetical protein [Streptomyces sp. ST2-7A]MCE7080251.1 hypothetical protein [Streptomyces sp. ST2-7A]
MPEADDDAGTATGTAPDTGDDTSDRLGGASGPDTMAAPDTDDDVTEAASTSDSATAAHTATVATTTAIAPSTGPEPTTAPGGGGARPGRGEAPESPAPAVAPPPDGAPPPAPTQPPAPGSAEAPSGDPDPAPTPAPVSFHRRPWVRAAGHWVLAAALFAGTATGTALTVMDRERGDVPGLATEHDGRWEFGELTLPAPPEGRPRPFSAGNPAGIHHAEPRSLLLSAPDTAGSHPSLPDGDHVAPEIFAERFPEDERDSLLEELIPDHPLRHVTARGWTMPEDTEVEIFHLRFTTEPVARNFLNTGFGSLGTLLSPEGMGGWVVDTDWPAGSTVVGGVRVLPLRVKEATEESGYVRGAWLRAGDTIALVTLRHPTAAPGVPFEQTVILQARLLG